MCAADAVWLSRAPCACLSIGREAEERDREVGDELGHAGEQDAVTQLRAFLASRHIRIPCCCVLGNEEEWYQHAEDRWGWRDSNEVFFIDDRADCSSCAFGCRVSVVAMGLQQRALDCLFA